MSEKDIKVVHRPEQSRRVVKKNKIDPVTVELPTKTAKVDPEPVEAPKIEVATKEPLRAKLNDYRCFCLPNLKNIYLKLLNDNITYLIEYIYDNKEKEPYKSPEVRIALSMQMILSSDKLIPIQLSSLIAKDIDGLRKNNEYTSQWANPMMKRKRLAKELEMLKKHTEIDDSISLNLPDQVDAENKPNIDEFDIHSGLSTLNVSATCPIEEEARCSIM